MTPHSFELPDASPVHPSEEQMAAYLEGRLAGADHDAIVDHLCACPACRLEARNARALRVGARRGRRSFWLTLTTAVAAGLVFVLVPIVRSPRAPAVERSTATYLPADEIPRIVVLSPGSERAHIVNGLTFEWRAEAVDVEYSLTLQDSSGRIFWSATTTDTALSLPASARVSPGEYYWTVDALRPDGRTATTGTQRLRIK